MRFHSSMLMAGMLSASLFYAENMTLPKDENAQPIFDGVAQAHGGGDKLTSMDAVAVEHETNTGTSMASRSTAKPDCW